MRIKLTQINELKNIYMYFYLPEKHRQIFAKPLGILLKNNQTNKNIIKHLLNNSLLIAVGDTTTAKLLSFNLLPAIQIIDNKEKRIPAKSILPNNQKINLHCNNPPGQITEDSIRTIKIAFRLAKPIRITVEGEEDLLTIPVCLHAPDNSIVLYGQPNKGLVLVKVNNKTRKKVLSVMRYMNQGYDETGG